MILSRAEQRVLDMLHNCDGPMPVNWLKPHYRGAIPRLRELGMLRKRDPEWAHLTKLGRNHVSKARDRGVDTKKGPPE